jgi:hypothetical protein
VLLFDCYYPSHSLPCLAGLKILPEEVGDMRVILKAGFQTGRDPDFAMEINPELAAAQSQSNR